jgi:hypothetical protein
MRERQIVRLQRMECFPAPSFAQTILQCHHQRLHAWIKVSVSSPRKLSWRELGNHLSLEFYYPNV